jgi:heme O synthase-like polyprenyltransferase
LGKEMKKTKALCAIYLCFIAGLLLFFIFQRFNGAYAIAYSTPIQLLYIAGVFIVARAERRPTNERSLFVVATGYTMLVCLALSALAWYDLTHNITMF